MHDDALLDVAIIGGGAAGLAAGLQLARSRRSIAVVDAGEPRNAPAAHMHGYLGHDGLPPGDLLALGRTEVESYGGRVVDGAVTTVRPDTGHGFLVELAEGSSLRARRVLVATGLVDELPDVPGVAEQWGRGVVHCPYCHGWEVRDRRIVVLATHPMAGHQALLFRQLSDRVVVAVHDGAGPEGDDRRRLHARGVPVHHGPVAELVVEGDLVRGVRLADGRVLDADAVAVQPRFVARTSMLADLGIVPVPAPMGTGEMIEVDERGATSVAGVYAAGNVSDVSGQVLQAAAQGSRVAAMINADLAVEDAERALAAMHADPDRDSAEHWDRRYADVGDRLWSGQPNPALVTEAADLPPGTALDVGCGEGADALWLAEQGWDVTAVDISAVAVERGRQVAEGAGLDVRWSAVDILTDPLPASPAGGGYDLVSAQYPAFPQTPGDDAIRALLDAVAPGGTLLVVHHAFDHEHRPHAFDPADYVQPDDVARHLDDAWAVEVHERRPRVRPAGSPGPDVPDAVLRARRLR
ncbi:MAG: FAD-dependent oxidoreductase [Acidimicrobiia bacterium]